MKHPTHPPGLGVSDPALCLEFINTEGAERNSPPDRLDTLDLLLEWAVRQGVIDEGVARRLLATAAMRPEAAERFLSRARDFREGLYRIFRAATADERPAEDDLALLDRELGETLEHLRLAWQKPGARWILPDPPEGPAELLWPIAGSAADLLRSDLLDRVKECSSETCSWMFIDESRNRSRRWCDMADCGNRAKARRFYRRHAGK